MSAAHEVSFRTDTHIAGRASFGPVVSVTQFGRPAGATRCGVRSLLGDSGDDEVRNLRPVGVLEEVAGPCDLRKRGAELGGPCAA